MERKNPWVIVAKNADENDGWQVVSGRFETKADAIACPTYEIISDDSMLNVMVVPLSVAREMEAEYVD